MCALCHYRHKGISTGCVRILVPSAAATTATTVATATAVAAATTTPATTVATTTTTVPAAARAALAGARLVDSQRPALDVFAIETSDCGLGLFVSALATTQERAVFAVPLLLLPQILFSELAIPNNLYSDAVAAGEKVTPVHWAFRVFEESAALEPRWHMVALFLIILFAMATALIVVATVALLPQREVVT